ncbi:MAG TPA: endonuclease/exonuclease/phosphatase family protein [Candidatus Paceibacterota bacterium]|nr:endonuclease/exonuclease/phosphatase family protein [Candidatus Paceibacterota bacterium]
MRIMFLNAWGGALHEELIPYLVKQSRSIDVFCLQEVHHALRLSNLSERKILPERGKRERRHLVTLFNNLQQVLRDSHIGIHSPVLSGLHDLEGKPSEFYDYGLATFTRIAARPETFRASMTHRVFGQYNDGKPASRAVVSFTSRLRGRHVLIAHMHGLWTRVGKIDTPERIMQSRRVAELIAAHRREESWGEELPVIFGGDFNLTSECSALKRLENGRYFGPGGGESLTAKFGISDTRTANYKKPERQANFVLASKVLDAQLKVDYSAPSDHAALIVSIDES